MPTYVYKCADHGHVFDLVQKFTDEAGADCPICGSDSDRQVTAPTVIYKGSGFYTTDYGSGASSRNGNSTSASTSSDSGSKSTESTSSSTTSSSDSTGKKSSTDSSSNGTKGSHSHGAGSHAH